MNFELFPPTVRKVVYTVSVVLSALASGTLAYFTATGLVLPQWLIGGLAALGAVGLVPSGLALANVNRPAVVQPAPVGPAPVADGDVVTYDDGDLAIPAAEVNGL